MPIWLAHSGVGSLQQIDQLLAELPTVIFRTVQTPDFIGITKSDLCSIDFVFNRFFYETIQD